MRRFFYWFGIAAAVVLIVLVAGGVVLFRKGANLDAESKAYVETAVRAISSKWDQQELLDRASPDLLAMLKPDAVTQIFDKFSQYGPLVEYEGATGQANMSYVNGISKITAEYKGKAKFENGEATFGVALVKLSGKWLIYGFHIDPIGEWPTKQIEHT
jgi:hypothetical protein